MTDGHGDDIHRYDDIRINFSSNVYCHFNHDGLFEYLSRQMESIRNYPEPSQDTAAKAVAEAIHLQPEEVMVTNGATEGIYLTSLAFRRSLSAIVVPTFSEYADACLMHEHRIVCINSLDDIPQETHLAWICNPNNPTGRVHDKATLLQIVKSRPNTLFIIDASYAPFTRKPLISPTEAVSMPNILMLHSMTKEFAIPGLRLGYITANKSLLCKIRALQMPWSVNSMAQYACQYLLSHRQDYTLPLDMLLQERIRVSKAFEDCGMIETMPSDTHILLCRLKNAKASFLKDNLARNHGILIRDASNFAGLDDTYFRIAVQTPAENNQLINAITQQ